MDEIENRSCWRVTFWAVAAFTGAIVLTNVFTTEGVADVAGEPSKTVASSAVAAQ